MLELDSINSLLVEESIKLGSAILKSIQASKYEQDLAKKKKKKPEEITKESMSVGKGLLTGAAIAAVPALAANYTLNKASDDLDSKMLAIPGLAAATVGAILAAKQMNSPTSKPVAAESISELENAINAKQVVDSAMKDNVDTDLGDELSKMSSISTDHIASLITEILL